jgi:hypothetical protein
VVKIWRITILKFLFVLAFFCINKVLFFFKFNFEWPFIMSWKIWWRKHFVCCYYTIKFKHVFLQMTWNCVCFVLHMCRTLKNIQSMNFHVFHLSKAWQGKSNLKFENVKHFNINTIYTILDIFLQFHVVGYWQRHQGLSLETKVQTLLPTTVHLHFMLTINLIYD